MENLSYTETGLNISSSVANETVRFNCKSSTGAITGANVYNNGVNLHAPITLGSGSNPTQSTHRGLPTSATITGATIPVSTSNPRIGATFVLNAGTYYLSATMLFTPTNATGTMTSVGMQLNAITPANFDFSTTSAAVWSCGGFLSHVVKPITNAPLMYSTTVMVSLTTTTTVYLTYLFNADSLTTVSGNYYITNM